MHLAIDAVSARGGGGAVVLLSLIEAALETKSVSRVTVFAAKRRSFAFPESASLNVLEQPGPSESAIARCWWYASRLAAATKTVGADALLCLGGGGFAHRDVSSATLIQQSLPFSPEAIAGLDLRGRARVWTIRLAMRHSIDRIGWVFVQTQTMKEWVQRDFRVPGDKILVFPPPPPVLEAGPPSKKLLKMRASSGFRLLMVGDPHPHKNTELVVKGLQWMRSVQPTTKLFVTYPEYDAPGVVALGSLDRTELHEAYSLADVLVMPSLVETVGLPMLEAAQMGVPILAADRPYAHEVCGDAAAYFDPLDAQSFTREACELLDADEWRADLVKTGQERAAHLASGRAYHRMIEALAG